MRLDSVRSLKQQLIASVVDPFASTANLVGPAAAVASAASRRVARMVGEDASFGIGARPFDTMPQIHRSVALGIAPYGRAYRLAIRLQRAALRQSDMVARLVQQARGEVDMKVVGRIDKRAKTAARSRWYRGNTRPLLIGASVGHLRVTAGTIGGFAMRGRTVCILSNNHVLANEDRARRGDTILQRGALDGGRSPRDRVARLGRWVRLKRTGVNVIDAALAVVDEGIAHDPTLLRGLVNGRDRRLAGLGPEFLDEGAIVHKVGRTTGATRGRVTAFDLDNVVVNYDVGNLRFDGQIEIESAGQTPFSDGGDSGSLIVNADMRAVALLFAGSDMGGRGNLGLTYANPIHAVLAGLGATLLP
jgi:hypothetical protein